MNNLAISQLIFSALHIIREAKHGSIEYKVITEVKSELEKLCNYYKQQHEEQLKSQEPTKTEGEQQDATNTR